MSRKFMRALSQMVGRRLVRIELSAAARLERSLIELVRLRAS